MTSINFVLWLLAAGLLRHRAFATRPRSNPRRWLLRAAPVGYGLAMAATLAELVSLVLLSSQVGGLLVSRRDVAVVVAVVVPAALTPWRVLPALRRQRSAARALVPVYAAAAAAAVGFFEPFFPPEPGIGALAMMGALPLAGAVLGLVRARQAASAPLPRRSRRARATRVVATLAAVAVAAIAVGALASGASRHPETYTMMRGTIDYGGGAAPSSPRAPHDDTQAQPAAQTFDRHHASGPETTSVTELRGPAGEPDEEVELTAGEVAATLSSGTRVEGWGFNGSLPGPALEFDEGDLVEVTLRNDLPEDPVTIHWHGIDVPNGEDGVAGVTQDAVAPGEEFTYRFRAEESGSHWYHSHQNGSEQVARGLFGPLVLQTDQDATVDHDLPMLWHEWTAEGRPIGAFGLNDTLQTRTVAEGDTVRLRLVNTTNQTQTFTLTGTEYRVSHVDGEPVAVPTPLRDERLVLGAGGRFDVTLSMPDSPVRLVNLASPDAGLLLANDPGQRIEPNLEGPDFDIASYGSTEPHAVRDNADWDRSFELVLDEWLGFYDGHFGLRQTVNGNVFPATPMHMVEEGDMVKMRFINRGSEDHPMHLHGHHMTILSKNGVPASGSPLAVDTVLVRPGEVWEVGFEADNPGLWMDHCHDLRHARLGLVLHLAYVDVTTPFQIGGHAGNHPE